MRHPTVVEKRITRCKLGTTWQNDETGKRMLYSLLYTRLYTSYVTSIDIYSGAPNNILSVRCNSFSSEFSSPWLTEMTWIFRNQFWHNCCLLLRYHIRIIPLFFSFVLNFCLYFHHNVTLLWVLVHLFVILFWLSSVLYEFYSCRRLASVIFMHKSNTVWNHIYRIPLPWHSELFAFASQSYM